MSCNVGEVTGRLDNEQSSSLNVTSRAAHVTDSDAQWSEIPKSWPKVEKNNFFLGTFSGWNSCSGTPSMYYDR